MKISKLLVITMLMSSVIFADDMGHKDLKKEFTNGSGDTANQSYKYKLGSKVLINLKGTRFNGKCSGLGEIWNIGFGKYYVKGVKCEWGYENTFKVDEESILDVLKKEDFEDDGRYEEGGWFTRDKTEDWMPCLRNDFDEDTKEKLCEKNKLMFY